MNLEPGQEVFEVMIAANKVGLVIGTYTVYVISSYHGVIAIVRGAFGGGEGH